MASKPPAELETLSHQTQALIEVINNEPDMACVLITGSFLDQCLASLLYRYFIKSNTANNLLSFKGNLGTYSSRVNLCYCLGLITKGMRQNLDIIGEIRNLFGHTHLMLDFSNQEIKSLCDKLTFPKFHQIVGGNSEELPINSLDARHRFSTISFLLTNRIILAGLAMSHKEPLGTGWE